MRESSDGGLTPEELAELGPGTVMCGCGHWDTIHGFFCMAEKCDCGEFTRLGAEMDGLDAPTVSQRVFWSKSWDSSWWKPLILVGFFGGDENCNRTIGLRLPGGALFLCLNVPLRQQPCDECAELMR
jgi:hypothetical protein